jgi:hypothetical protein
MIKWLKCTWHMWRAADTLKACDRDLKKHCGPRANDDTCFQYLDRMNADSFSEARMSCLQQRDPNRFAKVLKACSNASWTHAFKRPSASFRGVHGNTHQASFDPSDLDGDGKPDITLCGSRSQLTRNHSYLDMRDTDGDGRPDTIVPRWSSQSTQNRGSILQDRSSLPDWLRKADMTLGDRHSGASQLPDFGTGSHGLPTFGNPLRDIKQPTSTNLLHDLGKRIK